MQDLRRSPVDEIKKLLIPSISLVFVFVFLVHQARAVELVLGKGGDRLSISDPKGAELDLTLINPERERVSLEQYLVQPLRDPSGKIYSSLLRCEVIPAGPVTGRIDWVKGEFVARSPKRVLELLGRESASARYRLRFWVDAPPARPLKGLLRLVLRDGRGRQIMAYPVVVEVGAGANGVEVVELSDKGRVMVRNGKDGYVRIRVLVSGARMLKERSLPDLLVKVSGGGSSGSWQRLERILPLPKGEDLLIRFKVPGDVPAGRWIGKIFLQSAGATIPIPVEVEVKRIMELKVSRTALALRWDPKLRRSSLGELEIKVRANEAGGFSLVQEPTVKYLMSGKHEIPVSALEFRVFERRGEEWVPLTGWLKVSDRVVFYKAPGPVEADLKLVYRLSTEAVKGAVAGEYELPVRFSIVSN